MSLAGRALVVPLVLAALAFAGASRAEGAHEDFPTPRGLEANVRFWRNVYVRWSVNEIAFHDREDLSIVYRVVEVPAHGKKKGGLSRREHVKRAEDELVEVLRRPDKKQPASADSLEGLEREVYENLAAVERPDKYRRISLIRAQNGLREKAREGWIRVGRYEGQIRQILKDKGLPDDIIALAFVESLFSLYARSHAGAAGMWQFMRPTAKEYMQVHHVLDERHDPILATEAAAKYLLTAKRQLGPWPVAITSYNYGRSGMARAIKAVGTDDLGVIIEKYDYGRFGFAAKNYYASFLALLDVVRHPDRYFPGVSRQAPWRYDVVRLPFPVLADQLDEVGALSLSDLATYNPALTKAAKRGDELLPRGLSLRVPYGKGEAFVERLSSLSDAQRRSAQAHVRAWHKASGRETVKSIARRYGVDASQIASRLGASVSTKLKRGTRVPIPSVAVRYSLLPEARGLDIPKVEATGPLVADAKRPKLDERTVVSAVTTARPRVRVRVKVVSAEALPVTEPLPPVDVLTGIDEPPATLVDFIAGDPGADAPWALPESDLRRDEVAPPTS